MRIARLIAFIYAFLAIPTALAQPEIPSVSELIQQLKPSANPDDGKGVSISGGTSGQQNPPSIDLQVQFDYNSDHLTTDAL